MLITIGELANELVKYCSKLEMRIVGSTPIILAYLASKEYVTKVYLYIAQIAEYRYTIYSDIFDTGGSRFVPTGMTEKPFIRELEEIHSLYGGASIIDETYAGKVENVDYIGAIDYIHDLLYEYDLLRVSQSVMNSKISSFGFNNVKILRTLEKSFNSYGSLKGTVRDLFNIVVRNKNKFILNGLRAKDMKCIVDKLSDRGIYVTLNNDRITDVTFKRR